MNRKKILIVDDKKNICAVLSEILSTEGYATLIANSGEQGIVLFNAEKPDFLLTDLIMEEMSGVDFIREIRKSDSSVPIIILTAFGSISSAVEAMQAGADDYMTKPLNYEILKLKISKFLEVRERGIENLILKENLREEWGLEKIIGTSPAVEKIFRLIRAVAPTDLAVIIQGECGTGKELIAKSLHSNSLRVGAPFVVVDCSAIPENLIESELFGYEKGAFTGAISRKYGRIEESQGGTLFLDEIGELSLACQAKFLRVIQERQFVRIGGNEHIHIDFRLIVATNKNLKEEVNAGRFRADLFYRLNVINIESPPLRLRKDDIPLIAESFMQQACMENKKNYRTINKEALAKMMGYNWPGNVRELKNCVQRLCILNTLPDEVKNCEQLESSPINSVKLYDREKDIVKQALSKTDWNISKAAKILGIGRKALYNRIKKYNLSVQKGTVKWF